MGIKKSYKKSGMADTELNLTSLMDIFTTLLIFLLANFSTADMKLTAPKDVVLPTSTAIEAAELALDIIVSPNAVFFDSKSVVPVADGKIDKQFYNKDNAIEPLFNAMTDKLKSYEYIAQLRKAKEAETAPPPEEGAEAEPEEDNRYIMVMAHKSIEFKLIEDVVYTAAHAGIGKFRFAVMKKE